MRSFQHDYPNSHYFSGGERCTHKAAGDRYLALPYARPAIDNARMLYRTLRDRRLSAPTINVAGNGIATLSEGGISQDEINAYIYDVLCPVHEHWGLQGIVSGGQTGVDLAGAVAGVVLDVPVSMLIPHGFRQRTADKVDRDYTESDIRAQVDEGVSELRTRLEAALPETASP